MTRIVLLRPGMTDFDSEGRITGNLDIPLNERGNMQALRLADEVSDQRIELVYHSPCRSATQTAEAVAGVLGVKNKPVAKLQNLDHGLWQGIRIDELREKHRKVYRLWQEQPESICPPEGEMLSQAQVRVRAAVDKLIRKHRKKVVAIVCPEPLTTLVRQHLEHGELGDLWESICECGSWHAIDVESAQVTARIGNQP